MEHFLSALKTVRPSCLRGSLGRTDLPAVSWEQIGGLEEVKVKLQQVLVELYREPAAFLYSFIHSFDQALKSSRQ